ncbi:MAG: glycine--tRNA ligase [Patescibacteria group bacterium]|jgi:glycyl-tRNA synthetase
MPDLMQDVVSLAKRRGFVYQGSEIYGGLANTWDYGPLGVELLRNIQNLWWQYFVHRRDDMLGLDTNIFMSPRVWEASGHTRSFTDSLVDCKICKNRKRADHLIEEYFQNKGEEIKVEGLTLEELDELIKKHKIPCPKCGGFNWTKPRRFNLLFETAIGIVTGEKNEVYLRGEIAQGMFVNFKNVLDSFGGRRLPFGLAQSGKAFRNEVTMGNFIFRTLQFNLSELEYFFDPSKQEWEQLFEYWQEQMWNWTTKVLGIKEENLRWRAHTDAERSHYSKRTEDIEYQYPFGWKEMYGLAYRTDYDLRNHMEKSGVDLRYTDVETGNKFIPHVIEPTFGMDRTLLTVLLDSYVAEEKRTFLKIPVNLAPYKIAVFPLLKNREELVAKAREVFDFLKESWNVTWDDRGNIGKRYYSQDEIGTPFCITVDYDTLDKDDVTVRNRDTMDQERVGINRLEEYFKDKIC